MTAGSPFLEGAPHPPTVFISYSWDTEEHKRWVLEFAQALVKAGIDVTLDQWHLPPGQDAIRFMEESAANSDYVLVICTPEYAAKANARIGAAGYETAILSSSLVEDLGTKKFIPILRAGGWGIRASIPRWLAGREGVDLRTDPYSSENFERLLRALHGKPLGPPPLGEAPEFGDTDSSTAISDVHLEMAPATFRSGSTFLLDASESLSAREQELLWNARQDESAQIAHIKAIGGERLSVNNQTFPEQRDPRSKAEWFGALRTLIYRGLIEGIGSDPDYYRLTDQGWQATDELTDFAVWDVSEVTIERRYVGRADPDVLALKCRKIVHLPAEFYPDEMGVKEPKTLIVEGIDTKPGWALPFEPTHAWFVDPASKSDLWFCLYPGSEVVGRIVRLPVND